jgi:hypothetical protein
MCNRPVFKLCALLNITFYYHVWNVEYIEFCRRMSNNLTARSLQMKRRSEMNRIA